MGKRKGIRKVLRLFIFHAVSLLSASYAQATTKMYFVHTDHLGTPQVLTDSNQEVVWEGHQSPFGEMNNDQGAVSQSLRFPGQYADAETGFSYNYFRDYDPSLGRYLQSDPIGLGGGINTYGYANQNPLVYVDPDGRQPLCFVWPWGTIACGVAAVGTAFGVKSCTDGYDDLLESNEKLESHYDNMSSGYECVLSGECDPEPYFESGAEDYNEHLEKALDGIKGIGGATPHTSVTGPVPSSAPDLVIYGTGNIAGEALSDE